MACFLREQAFFLLKASKSRVGRRVSRWVIALTLLLPLYGASVALLKTGTRLIDDTSIWTGAVCGFFCWAFCFWRLPKPMWIYVAAHELTHVLAGFLFGAVLKSIKIKSSGGRVELPHTNTFITLSPYFIPLYTVLWCFFIWLLRVIWGVDTSPFWFAFGLGLTYAFHVTLTAYILRIKQPDFVSEGYFLSFILTLLGNLLFLLLTAGCLGNRLTLAGEISAWARETVGGAINLYHWLGGR